VLPSELLMAKVLRAAPEARRAVARQRAALAEQLSAPMAEASRDALVPRHAVAQLAAGARAYEQPAAAVQQDAVGAGVALQAARLAAPVVRRAQRAWEAGAQQLEVRAALEQRQAVLLWAGLSEQPRPAAFSRLQEARPEPQ
jgi:hypothetical protein